MKLLKEEFEMLPCKICIYSNPDKNWNGLPWPQVYVKSSERCSPRTRRIDALDTWSVILSSLGIMLTILPGIVLPWCLVVTIPMIAAGIACVHYYYKEIDLEYYRLYQKSLTREQQERRDTFIQWYNTQSQKVKEIKSKPLSEITLEDKEFVEKTEDQLRGLEWI